MLNRLNRRAMVFLASALLLLLIVAIALMVTTNAKSSGGSGRAENAMQRVKPSLESALKAKGLSFGSPIFIRIFKQSSILELWVEQENGNFIKFKDYDICTFSGDLGPKLQEGDRQSPEGFYFVKAGSMNPWSKFHLSFNLGFPNAYDRAHERTGSALMVHGSCVSIGCYAMTDEYIEEIYSMADAALQNGQAFFRVHAFPFKMTDDKLAQYTEHQWFAYWQNLKEGFDYFEVNKRPPNVLVENKRYVFGDD